MGLGECLVKLIVTLTFSLLMVGVVLHATGISQVAGIVLMSLAGAVVLISVVVNMYLTHTSPSYSSVQQQQQPV